MDDYQRYKSAVRWLEQRSVGRTREFMTDRSHPERYIERMRSLLDRLGNPDRGMKYVHITGTAGKGTVSTMVHNGLRAAGKRVGLFTSPYCVTVAENIQMNGRLISATEFADLVDRVRPIVKIIYQHFPRQGPSYFEVLLAIAFLYFQKKKCEWVVLEVGLGGRYDATNVITNPAVCAITNIGMDHTNVLGPTLRHIARDKSGIIKSGSIFFTTEHRTSLLRLFHSTCRTVGARFTTIEPQADAQATNRILATSILESLRVSSAAINQGLNKTQLPCRFEIVARHPLIVLDGAHNAIKISALFDQLIAIKHQRLIVVCALLDDKDAKSIARVIARCADSVILTKGSVDPMPGRRWASLATLSQAFRSQKFFSITKQKSPREALVAAQNSAASGDTIVVTGSFYLAGEFRRNWYSERSILAHRSSFLTR